MLRGFLFDEFGQGHKRINCMEYLRLIEKKHGAVDILPYKLQELDQDRAEACWCPIFKRDQAKVHVTIAHA